MSNTVSALNGEAHPGFAEVAEAGLQGMITLRGDLASARLAAAVKKATGCAMPEPRRIAMAKDRGAAWMSPDELLLLVPYADAPATVVALEKALARDHALVTDVSDARAVFRIRGGKAAEVLMKLCPVDFGALEAQEIRRTRVAQVAGALWWSGPQEMTVVSFRSVAGYVMGLLQHSARPGSEIFPG